MGNTQPKAAGRSKEQKGVGLSGAEKLELVKKQEQEGAPSEVSRPASPPTAVARVGSGSTSSTQSSGSTPSSRAGRKTPPGLKFLAAEEPAPTDPSFIPRPLTAPARPSVTNSVVSPSPDLTFPLSARVGCGRRPRPSLNLAIPADAHHNVTKILDFMLVGGDDISTNLVILREHNVKTIVNATTDGGDTFPAESGIVYLKLNWKDEADQPILADMERAFVCIDEAKTRGGVCLVHCKSGMSRSGSVAIAYLMHANKMTLLEALTFCRNKRPIISPNPGFMSQLVQYEQEERGSVSIDLTKYEENRFGDTSVLVCAA